MECSVSTQGFIENFIESYYTLGACGEKTGKKEKKKPHVKSREGCETTTFS